MATRVVQDAHLRVAPELVGLPLASPSRRALALAVDLALLVLPTVAVAVAAAALSLRLADRPAYDATRALISGVSDSAARHAALRAIAPLLVRLEAEGLPPAVAVAVEEGRLDEAARLLATRSLLFSLRFEEDTGPARPPDTLRVPVEKLIPGSVRAAALFGVPAVYFTLLTSFGGRTLGKRLAGIRVRRLDGGRLSLADSFERFTGYLQVPAALGTPIGDLWRDPNRQLPHDRTVHTVVVRTARPRRRPEPQEESQPKPEAEPGPAPQGDGPEGPPAGT